MADIDNMPAQAGRFAVGDHVKHRRDDWTGVILKVIPVRPNYPHIYGVQIDGRPESYYVAQTTSLEGTAACKAVEKGGA